MPGRSRWLRVETLAPMLALCLGGCQAVAPAPHPPVPALPRVEVPREAPAHELVAPHAEAPQLPPGLAGPYRFRTVLLDGRTLYLPYVASPGDGAFVPYYASYDPEYYYLPAYSAPAFGGQAVLLRLPRRSGASPADQS